MKKITLFLLCFMAFASLTHAQLFGKKELQEHSSEPGYFWFKPVVDVDTTTLEKTSKGGNANTLFLIEAYLSDGAPIEVFVEGKTLKFLLRLPAKQAAENDPTFEGYMFTVKSLGSYSFQTKRSIRNGNYYEKQKNRLMRERNTKKYELWSEAPTKVTGKLIEKKILPVDVEPLVKEKPENKPAAKEEKKEPDKKEEKKSKRDWGN